MSSSTEGNRRRIFAGLAGIACLFISILLLLHIWESRRADKDSLAPETDRDSIAWQNKKYTQRKDLDTVLVMGLDKFEDDQVSGEYLNRQQCDFLLLIAVDRDSKTYSVLHLNRDTMADISVLGKRGERVDTVHRQLALAHTYGKGGSDSCRNAVEAVSNLLHGVKIDHYLSMTMDAVSILNDYVGGVEVEILDDFSAVDPSLVQGQVMTLKGSQALTYVRTRRNLEDSSNLHRMERQRQYLSALRETFSEKCEEDSEFAKKALMQVADYLTSDLTVNQLSAISERLDGYTFTGFETIDGEAVVGEKFMEYYVDKEDLMETVLKLYYEEKN